MPVKTSSRYHYRAKHRPVIVRDTPELQAAREGLEAFGEYVLGVKALPIHRQWINELITGKTNEIFNQIAGDAVNVLSFRGSGKTTWLRLFVAWALGHNPHLQIGWIANSETIALRSSRIIKRIIKSRKYGEVFPATRPGERWSDREWEISKATAKLDETQSDVSFVAIGALGAIASNRFHLLIYDDLIKSSAQIRNPEIRAKMQLNVEEVIQPCLIPGGREICLGTRFHRQDIYATYFTPENGWKVVVQAAIVDGESAWPERFTLQILERIRKRNPLVFAYQYQNQIPPNEDESVLNPQWIRYAAVPKAFDQLILGVDLAASESEKADYTALVLVGVADSKAYILEAIRFRAAGNLEKIKRILELRKVWGNFVPVFERVAYQASMEGDWKAEMKRRRLNLPCRDYVPRGDKRSRLEGVSGMFANEIVAFNRDRPMADLVDELLEIAEDHDDLRDAAVIALSHANKRTKKPLTFA
jgi:predicted phage terminase large subunit-like protein